MRNLTRHSLIFGQDLSSSRKSIVSRVAFGDQLDIYQHTVDVWGTCAYLISTVMIVFH